jgi:hypothetical protein
VRSNDCSGSPNNAIEADLCDDNRFILNNCSMSNYGFWLGYSRDAHLEHNTIVGCFARAIQIENGQNDTIAHNTIINRADIPTQSLIYLYQNGRDTTPSGPYEITDNVFGGSAKPVEVMRTLVKASGNQIIATAAPVFFGDAASQITIAASTPLPFVPQPKLDHLTPDTVSVGPSAPITSLASPCPSTWEEAALAETTTSSAVHLSPHYSVLALYGSKLMIGPGDPVVEVNGWPARLLSEKPDRLDILVPQDFWDQPAPPTSMVRVFNGEVFGAPAPFKLEWLSAAPRIETITPNPAPPGTAVVLTGERLQDAAFDDPVVYLDGKTVPVSAASPTSLTFAVPPGMISSRKFNLMIKSSGESVPIPLSVQAPSEWEPHITAASFSPTKLEAGHLLHFTATIKNNAPYALAAGEAGSGRVYDEKETFGGQNLQQKPDVVYIRVTSDLTGGTWPYLWSLSQPLSPGESATIEGAIRVETPGVTHYRVGLVDGGMRWIDEDLFDTAITVVPVLG